MNTAEPPFLLSALHSGHSQSKHHLSLSLACLPPATATAATYPQLASDRPLPPSPLVDQAPLQELEVMPPTTGAGICRDCDSSRCFSSSVPLSLIFSDSLARRQGCPEVLSTWTPRCRLKNIGFVQEFCFSVLYIS
jgi:hypothetical protein